MKRIGILYHPLNDAACSLSKEVHSFLELQGISAWLCSAWEGEKASILIQAGDTDLVVTIGGDGTILRAAQAVLPFSTPITGINLGKLGFMTELRADEAKSKLSDLLEGKGWIDERAMLETQLLSADQEPPRIFHALNDIVVARGAIARVVYIEASIDGAPLTTYKADGVITATATGSTGYSLAVGGPILHPRAEEFLLLPILPHLSLPYVMVLPPTSEVTLRLSTSHEATLSIDGHINLPLSDGAVIAVKRSPRKVRFLRIHPQDSFYSSLEKKLKGRQ